MLHKIILLALLLITMSPAWSSAAVPIEPATMWNLKSLSRVPHVFDAPAGVEQEGVKAILFEGEPYEGKPTRVFAYYGIPEHKPGQRVPGVVLVHGGGGTAFAEWVRIWNQHGYAAIAIDHNGGIPVVPKPKRGSRTTQSPYAPHWKAMRSPMWDDMKEQRSIGDCWMYHAVASTVLAHSLLASMDGVDPDRIGLTGISWGGIITSNVVGVDSRLKFAIPVYGCGFLYNGDNMYTQRYNALPTDIAAQGEAMWDGSNHLPRATLPMLWVNGTNDIHFPLNIWQQSYRATKGPHTLAAIYRMGHSHSIGWRPKEIYVFADSIVKDGAPLTRIAGQSSANGHARVSVDPKTPIKQAVLIYTTDSGNWSKRDFEKHDATVSADGLTAEADIPAGTTAYYFNLTDDRGLTVSSEHVNVPPTAAPQRKPNVIFVMTDDQGYKDVHALGHPYIITPNIDRLYHQSVRAEHFHVRPTCAPTRAAIMSGRDPMRSGVWHTIMGRSLMRTEEVTVAETFKAGGYATGLFGKWHLGDNYPLRPEDQGFDTVVRHLGGGVTQGPDYYGNDYFDDHYQRNGKYEQFPGFCGDVWFNEAMKFIEANKDRPFFAYVATNTPHHPWNVAEKYKKPYEELGVAETAVPYDALITNIDENMGRLMARLDELGLSDNTILVFTTDNGPAGGWPLHGDKNIKPLPNFTAGMSGAKGSCYEGGHRVPFFLRWPAGGLASGRDVDATVFDVDILPTLAELCGIQKPDGPPIDGYSFASALYGKPFAHDDRYRFIQTQRRPIPSKDAATVVLNQNWRLVLNESEKHPMQLFDVNTDLREHHNLADKYPQRVKDMLAAYDKWWDSQTNMFDKYSRIGLGSDAEPETRLMSHDWLTDDRWHCVWSQDYVKEGVEGNGPWAVNIVKPGRYRIELRRWPREHPGPIEADHAHIKIGDQMAQQALDPTKEKAVFELELPAGPTMVQTWLRSPNSTTADRGAYYVYVKRVYP